MKMMDKEAPMFAGMYWAHEHMDQLMMMKHMMPHMNYIIATMSSMMGYMSEGKEIKQKYQNFKVESGFY